MFGATYALPKYWRSESCVNDSTDGTAKPGASGGTIKSGLKIAFLPKQVNNPYFDTSDNKGGKVAVWEFKGTFTQTGPSEASPSAQVSYINTLSQQCRTFFETCRDLPAHAPGGAR